MTDIPKDIAQLSADLAQMTRERDEALAERCEARRDCLELACERDALRLREIALQAQVNAFYSGTSNMRLLAMTRERDALRAEVERLRGALLTLANAADTVGVMHFDSDSWPQEVDAMRDATIAARAALQEPTP